MSTAEKIQRLLDQDGMTQEKLAAALGRSQSTIARWARGEVEPEGAGRDAVDELYERTFGASPRQVRLMGHVGGGAIVEAIENGADEWVEAPADARPSTVAVQVKGNSMFPAYESRSILYYSRLLPPQEMINRRAIVQLADGRIFVKLLRAGSSPNSWTLQSLNPNFEDIEDVTVEWASPIDWIKPGD